MRINRGDFTRCGSGNMVNIAREISKWLLECEPQVRPIHDTFAPHVPNLASSRNADPKRDINGLQRERMAHLPPVGAIILVAVGRPVARRNSAITSARRNLAPHHTDLLHKPANLSVCTDFNRFVQRPGTVRIERIRACGKRCASATIDSASSSPPVHRLSV